MTSANKRLTGILLTGAFLLLVPFTAMKFTNDVNWGVFDFILAGILLFGSGLTIELVLRKVTDTRKRIIYCCVILFVLFLVWAELAVGIFGTPLAGS